MMRMGRVYLYMRDFVVNPDRASEKSNKKQTCFQSKSLAKAVVIEAVNSVRELVRIAQIYVFGSKLEQHFWSSYLLVSFAVS